MAYEPKPNSGSLFANEHKKTPNHPDMRGDIHMDKTLLEDLINKSKGGLVKIAVSAWKKETSNGKKFLSLVGAEPYEKPKSDNPWD